MVQPELPLYQVQRGAGPDLILVHGTASDADGWTTQLATLSSSFRVTAYDRRGTDRSPLPPGSSEWSVANHAQDLLRLMDDGLEAPIAVGSSFGAVVALEAARENPGRFRGLVLIEPPLPEADGAPTMSESYIDLLRQTAEERGGEASAAFFLRTVLGPEAYEAMPERWRARSCALWPQVHLDSSALLTYRPRFDRLWGMSTPTLLVGGGRSALHFRAPLHALERALPEAQLEIIEAAGHMLHAEAARSFAEVLTAFSARCSAA